MLDDMEIAANAEIKPIEEIAEKLRSGSTPLELLAEGYKKSTVYKVKKRMFGGGKLGLKKKYRVLRRL